MILHLDVSHPAEVFWPHEKVNEKGVGSILEFTFVNTVIYPVPCVRTIRRPFSLVEGILPDKHVHVFQLVKMSADMEALPKGPEICDATCIEVAVFVWFPKLKSVEKGPGSS